MVIYPDIEKVLVTYFSAALAAVGSPIATGVRVGTKKAHPLEDPQPTKEVVLIAALNGERDRVTRTASLTIEVYADSYANANELSLLVAALAAGCVGTEIKQAVVRMGPVRVGETGTQEKRYLDVGLVVKGTDL